MRYRKLEIFIWLYFLITLGLRPEILIAEDSEFIWAKNYLAQFPKIRVLIETAAGAGPESMGISIVKKLKSLGYKGKIEIVADEMSRYSLRKIIPMLPTNLREVIELPSLGATLQYVQSVRNLPTSFEITNLSILAEASGSLRSAYDITNRFRTRGLMVINSPGWEKPSVHFPLRHRYLAEKHLPLAIEQAEVKNPHAFLTEQLLGDELSPKLSGLLNLTNPEGNFETLMSYNNVGNQYYFDSLILGYRRAVAKKPELFKGPLVIGALSDKISSFEYFNALHDQVPPSIPPSKIFSLDITDPNLAEALSSLGKNDVLFVRIGKLPQDVFNWVLGQSTLPALVTGANSTNHLRSLGKPYFSTSMIGHQWPSKMSLATRAKIFPIRKWDNLSGMDAKSTERFFLAIREANSSLNKDYAREAKRFDPNNDRFMITLRAFAEEKEKKDRIDRRFRHFDSLESMSGICQRLLYLLAHI